MTETDGILSDLTPGELEALRLLSKGYSNRGIATVLNRQESTVKQIMNRVYSKLFAGTNLNQGSNRGSAILIYLIATGQLSMDALKEPCQSCSKTDIT